MHDALGILARHVNGGMDGEAGRIDVVGAVHHLVAVLVHLDQGRRCDLFEHHAEGVQQKVMLRTRHPDGEMGEEQVVPTVIGDDAVERGKVHSSLPLLRRHHVLHGINIVRIRHVKLYSHGSLQSFSRRFERLSFKNLARVQYALWVERLLDRPHGSDFIRGACKAQIGPFLKPHPVFGRDRSAA